MAEERRRKRQELLSATVSELAKIKERVDAGRLKKAKEIALRVGKVTSRWRMAKHIELVIDDGRFEYRLKEEQVAREAELDGIYVIRTDVGAEKLPAEAAVRGYKSLKFVEQDIRDTRTELEVRPVFHRLEDRVRCHAFLCLLARYVRWHMMRALGPLLAEEKEYSFELLMEHLETIQRNTMEIAGQQFNLTT